MTTQPCNEPESEPYIEINIEILESILENQREPDKLEIWMNSPQSRIIVQTEPTPETSLSDNIRFTEQENRMHIYTNKHIEAATRA